MLKRELLKNKLFALVLITVGLLTTWLDSDVTFLLFSSSFAVPLLLTKENWVP